MRGRGRADSPGPRRGAVRPARGWASRVGAGAAGRSAPAGRPEAQVVVSPPSAKGDAGGIVPRYFLVFGDEPPKEF
jgi:hypothetical protein